MNHIPWVKIRYFHNVRKHVLKYYGDKEYKYSAKIKLHGTNAGIRIRDGQVVGQFRNKLIDCEQDNQGFAVWLSENMNWANRIKLQDGVVYGEWCGKGIFKSTSVSEAPRMFCIFSVVTSAGEVITEPKLLKAIIPENGGVYILP